METFEVAFGKNGLQKDYYQVKNKEFKPFNDDRSNHKLPMQEQATYQDLLLPHYKHLLTYNVPLISSLLAQEIFLKL